MGDGPRKPRTAQQEAKREEALSLLASGRSNRRAADQVGVDESTIRTWLKEESFSAELEERLLANCAQAERRLKGAAPRLASRMVKVALGLTPPSCGRSAEVTALRDALTRIGVGKGQRIEISGGLSSESDANLEAALEKYLAERAAGG